MKVGEGGLEQTAIRALTGVPTFTYSLNTTPAFNATATFALLSAADKSNYIMTTGTTAGSD